MSAASNTPTNRSMFRHPCPNKKNCKANRKDGNIFCFNCYWKLSITLRHKLYAAKSREVLVGVITLCMEFLDPHDEREDKE